ncbi:hypothetical protein ABIE67_010184 [Streptomyces sp. V4I8]
MPVHTCAWTQAETQARDPVSRARRDGPRSPGKPATVATAVRTVRAHDYTNITQPARRKPRRKGRPTLLTPARMDLLTRATAAGLPVKQAADAAGIGRSTFLRWMALGEDAVESEHGGLLDGDSPNPYASLYARVTRARAAAVVRAHGHIEEAARGAVVSETHRTWTDPVTGEHRSEKRIRWRPTGAHPRGCSCGSTRTPSRSTSSSTRKRPASAERGETPMERALPPTSRTSRPACRRPSRSTSRRTAGPPRSDPGSELQEMSRPPNFRMAAHPRPR